MTPLFLIRSLFLQTGIIDEIPTSICEPLRKPVAGAQGKNVILVVGDGMGWGKFLVCT